MDSYYIPECPTCEWDCPYIDRLGLCRMYDADHCTPYEECDAWYGLEIPSKY